MPTEKLPGVNKIRTRLRNGEVREYLYHRATGTRLPDDPASAEFVKRLTELNLQMARPDASPALPGTVAGLVVHYRSSPEFLQRKPKTRQDYVRFLDVISANWGANNVVDIDREALVNLRDAFQDSPRSANYAMAIVRRLLSFALDRPQTYPGMNYNVALRPPNLDTGVGHRPWEETEIAAFRKHWPLGTLERTLFELGMATGQRGEDVVAMKRSHIGPDGMISVKQEKTNARVWIPQSEDLKEALARWDEVQAARIAEREAKNRRRRTPKPIPLDMKVMLVTGERGNRLLPDNFRHIMIDAYRAVEGLGCGLANGGVTTHGLRYTAAVVMCEMGCDWETIASITGHATIQMVKKYLEKKRLAQLGVDALNRAARIRLEQSAKNESGSAKN